MQGNASYDEEAAKVGRPWSKVSIVIKNGRVYINGLDIEKIWDDLNLANALFEASKKPGECGPLTDLVFDQLVKFKFSFNVDFEFDDKNSPNYDPNGVKATVRVTFRLMLSDTGKALDEFPLPDCVETIPFNTPTVEELFKWLYSIAVRYIGKVAEYLLEHPQELAKLLAWMNVKQFSKDLVHALICRHVEPENITQRHREVCEEHFPRPRPDPPQPQPQPEEGHCRCNGSGLDYFLCSVTQSVFH